MLCLLTLLPENQKRWHRNQDAALPTILCRKHLDRQFFGIGARRQECRERAHGVGLCRNMKSGTCSIRIHQKFWMTIATFKPYDRQLAIRCINFNPLYVHESFTALACIHDSPPSCVYTHDPLLVRKYFHTFVWLLVAVHAPEARAKPRSVFIPVEPSARAGGISGRLRHPVLIALFCLRSAAAEKGRETPNRRK